MSMTKKDFIALADVLKNRHDLKMYPIEDWQTKERIMVFPSIITELADFCATQNPNFNRERWLAYIAGECGPSGGTIKKGKA